jgi:predicted lipoprotein with Yx(FWY)xxD motif
MVRPSIKFLLPTLAVSLVLGACGSSSSTSSSGSSSASAPASSGTSTTASTSGSTVKTATVSSVGGTVLVNSQGLTLYRLTGEHAGKFICTTSACLAVWHPLTVSSGSKPSGSVSSLGVVKRSNGMTQVTYKGEPLYTFAHDSAPGQATGEGLKDVGTWLVIKTGASSSASAPVPSTTSTSSSGGGYAY